MVQYYGEYLICGGATLIAVAFLWLLIYVRRGSKFRFVTIQAVLQLVSAVFLAIATWLWYRIYCYGKNFTKPMLWVCTRSTRRVTRHSA